MVDAAPDAEDFLSCGVSTVPACRNTTRPMLMFALNPL
nr:MAG TPA: hypothetical protein [Caudoviricetes sp.]